MTENNFEALGRLISLLPGLTEDTRRALVEVLCESGLKMISRLVEGVGDAQHPVDVAVTMIDIALKAGHPDILNTALGKVDVTWPPEIVVAFWAATSKVADQLPARDTLWERFESRLLPVVVPL
jgi:hypothetical protein